MLFLKKKTDHKPQQLLNSHNPQLLSFTAVWIVLVPAAAFKNGMLCLVNELPSFTSKLNYIYISFLDHDDFVLAKLLGVNTM